MARTEEDCAWEKWVVWYPDDDDDPPNAGIKGMKKGAPDWAKEAAREYIRATKEGISL